jgi:glycerol kinase
VSDIAPVGVTNQRETTVVWNRRTGERHRLARHAHGGDL